MKAWSFSLGVLALVFSLSGKETAVSSNEEYYTNTWVIELHRDLPIEEVDMIAKSHGFTCHGKVFPNLNYYEFQHSHVAKRSSDSSTEHTENLMKHPHVRTVEQQVAKVRVKRDHASEMPVTLTDPKWSDTWYLNRGVKSNTDFDMNVIPAWQMGYTGKGIVVTILDDGLEHDHPDLQQNYDERASKDINSNDNDPMPRYDYTNENRHGTRCAGEVAAVANNSICSVGVAYNAGIGGVRMLDGDVTDLVESLSLSHNRDYIDIYSASWGPDDNGRTVDGPGKLAKKAFIDGVEQGRNKTGSIFVWASGNGGLHEDSCACDGYTNSIYTLSVSSASESNDNPWYLEQCASTIATTYSSGANYGQKQIVSTDLRKQCTDRHTGTSASAPLAAGLIAVMLQANPRLTWRDVQYITILSANPEPLLQSGEFRTNAVNRKYSHKFGYGLMDCAKMVEYALKWKTVPTQLKKQMPKVSVQEAFNSVYTKKVTVDPCAPNDQGCIRFLEHVQLSLQISSSKRGELQITLTSPSGTKSTILPKRRSDAVAASFDEWPFMSVHFWGENPAGTWTFEIDNGQETGKLTSYQLIFYGVSLDPYDLSRSPTGSHIVCHETCEKDSCFGSGPDQCKTCADKLYRIESSNTCVKECGDGYYPDGSQYTCVPCDKTCATCKGPGKDNCIDCSRNLIMDEVNHCVEQCNVGFYSDDIKRKCLKCKPSCTACTSEDDCITCTPGFQVVDHQCKQNCKPGEFRNAQQVCDKCSDYCNACTNKSSCIECKSPYYLYQGFCRDSCPASAFYKSSSDGHNLQCFDCNANCASCYDSYDNNCETCNHGYVLTASHRCVVNRSCEIGKYKTAMFGDCQDCHPDCHSCHGGHEQDCTSCKEGRYLKDGRCVENCGTYFFHYTDQSSDGHRSCQPCHNSCYNCTGPTDHDCTTCIVGNLTKGFCDRNCSSGSYATEDHCKNCSRSCLTCNGPRESDCTSCTNNLFLDQGKCVEQCSPRYFALPHSNICYSCSPECETCNGPSTDNCLSCDDSHFLYDRMCISQQTCYQNQYLNVSTNECMRCHESCVNCSGPSEKDCTSCNSTQRLRLYSKTNQCVLCCEKDHILQSICCDCSIPTGDPACDLSYLGIEDTSDKEAYPSIDKFIIFILVGVLCSVGLWTAIFVFLQLRKGNCKCPFRRGDSKLLVHDREVIRYTQLVKPEDMIDDDDGYIPGRLGSKANMTYSSD